MSDVTTTEMDYRQLVEETEPLDEPETEYEWSTGREHLRGPYEDRGAYHDDT